MFGFFRKRRWQKPAEGLYLALVAQSRQPRFYEELGVPDTVDGRFDMICLHAFLVLRRLRSEEAEDPAALAQAVFDLMFQDMDRNLREMGVGDLSVGKHIKGMAKALYGRIAVYGDGLEQADNALLIDALSRNLFRKAEPTAEQVTAMVSYLRSQAASLSAQPLSALLDGKVTFSA